MLSVHLSILEVPQSEYVKRALNPKQKLEHLEVFVHVLQNTKI